MVAEHASMNRIINLLRKLIFARDVSQWDSLFSGIIKIVAEVISLLPMMIWCIWPKLRILVKRWQPNETFNEDSCRSSETFTRVMCFSLGINKLPACFPPLSCRKCVLYIYKYRRIWKCCMLDAEPTTVFFFCFSCVQKIQTWNLRYFDHTCRSGILYTVLTLSYCVQCILYTY